MPDSYTQLSTTETYGWIPGWDSQRLRSSPLQGRFLVGTLWMSPGCFSVATLAWNVGHAAVQPRTVSHVSQLPAHPQMLTSLVRNRRAHLAPRISRAPGFRLSLSHSRLAWRSQSPSGPPWPSALPVTPSLKPGPTPSLSAHALWRVPPPRWPRGPRGVRLDGSCRVGDGRAVRRGTGRPVACECQVKDE